MSPAGPQRTPKEREYPPGPAVVPHRKNAAEWVMWAALWPVAWVVAKLTRCR
jgi:hypothetical protein